MKQTDSHILITGGGCREAIDGVRFVTNMSTGRTSAFLADTLAASGASVTAVMGQGAVLPERPDVRILRFESGADLSAQVQAELEEAHRAGNDYTAVIHAAAVSDFIPETVTTGGVTYAAGKHLKKLHSGDEMTVTFRAAPKIADSIRTWAGEHTLLFCFKLTNGATKDEQQAAVDKLVSHSAADYVIRNDLTQITREKHPFQITDRSGALSGAGQTLSDMAAEIAKLCNK